jgi:chromosome segregation protein
MQKMSVSAPDSTMEAIDAEIKRLGVSRSHFVTDAIDFYIGSGRNLKKEIDRLKEELIIKTEEAKSLSYKVSQLEERIPTIESQSRMKDYDLNRINNELAQKINENKSLSEKVLQLEESFPTIENKLAEAKTELNSKSVEVFQKDKKIHTLENQIADREEKIKSKVSELEQINAQIEQIGNQLNEAEKQKEKLGSALKSKEDEVSFLRGHVAQLTQSISQLALPPSQEEAKKRGWWQFWRKG